MADGHCSNCGAALGGGYCAACGQARPRPDDFSLRRMLGEAWSEISDTDSRLWRSLVGLAVPGRLTRAWLDHRWQQHLPPLRLYLIASGVYFLLAWDVSFQINVDMLRAAPEGTVHPTLVALYEDPAAVNRVSDLTALMKFLFVVVMGFWLALLHRGNRRPVGEHMVFALHYTTVDFALFSLVAPLLALSSGDTRIALFNSTTLLGVLVLGLWTMLAIRRVYGRSWPSSLLRGLAVLGMDLVLSLLAGQLAILIVMLTPE